LDGGQHNKDRNIIYDNERTKYLNSLGYKVIRFWDNDIFKNMNDVLESIYRELKMIYDFISTPPLGKPDTSPQSREGLESLPSLRGDVRRTEGSF
jgi:hypothetical protein